MVHVFEAPGLKFAVEELGGGARRVVIRPDEDCLTMISDLRDGPLTHAPFVSSSLAVDLRPASTMPKTDPAEVERRLAEKRKADDEEAFRTALQILKHVRLHPGDDDASRHAEREWGEQVVDNCHVWGDFYGPATSPHLARALAHRYLDRQGGDVRHLRDALARYGTVVRPAEEVERAVAESLAENERLLADAEFCAAHPDVLVVGEQCPLCASRVEPYRVIYVVQWIPGTGEVLRAFGTLEAAQAFVEGRIGMRLRWDEHDAHGRSWTTVGTRDYWIVAAELLR